MPLTNFIAPNSVVPLLRAKNKKQLLQELSARAARLTGLPEREIFDVLVAARAPRLDRARSWRRHSPRQAPRR